MNSQKNPSGDALVLEMPYQGAFRGLWADALDRLTRNRLALIGGIFVLLTVMVAVFAPLIAPYGPREQWVGDVLESPSLSHLMGTDNLGRDIFSRLVYGARISLAVGIFTQLIILLIGLPVGAIAGLAGGRIDNILMRITDIMYAFPDLLLIILFMFIFSGSIFGSDIFVIFMAIGIVSWTNMARLMRGQILSLKEQDFITAARSMGAGNFHIFLRHLLPNSLGPISVMVTFGIPRAIFAEAALSYLGLGFERGDPSWGTMIYEGIPPILVPSPIPYLILFPSLALGLLMIAFTFLGDGLRDALDPRMRE